MIYMLQSELWCQQRRVPAPEPVTSMSVSQSMTGAQQGMLDCCIKELFLG